MHCKIEYKAVFVTEGNKDTAEITEYGEVELEPLNIKFAKQEIEYKEDVLYLINGNARLKMILGKKITNLYKTDLGDIILITELNNVKVSDKCFKCKYTLYQQDIEISTTYLTISWLSAFN